MTARTHAERVSVLAVVTEGLDNQRKLTTSRNTRANWSTEFAVSPFPSPSVPPRLRSVLLLRGSVASIPSFR